MKLVMSWVVNKCNFNQVWCVLQWYDNMFCKQKSLRILVLVGGMHYGLPPPPPPNALTMTPSKPLIGPTQKIHDFSKAPVEVNDVNVTAQEESDTGKSLLKVH